MNLLLINVLLFSFFCAWGKVVPTKHSAQIIKEAEGLSLKKDRAGAQKILIENIKIEKDKKSKEELIKYLNIISEIFYTDKAQITHERGNSLLKQKPEDALKNFKSALELEPDNTKVLLSLGRAYLRLGKCGDATEIANSLETKNPFYEKNFVFKILSLTCSQDVDEIESVVTSFNPTNPNNQVFINNALAQHFYFRSQFAEAFKYIQRAIKSDENYPENYYWENQILEKMGKEGFESAKKYVKLCKSISKADVLKYDQEPRLCLEYKEIERKIEEELNSKKDL